MKTNQLILLCSAGFILACCSRSPKCWGEDKNKGEIVSSIQIPCSAVSPKAQHVITSASEYTATFSDSAFTNEPCQLPAIDFNKYTLLGQSASGDGCEIKVIREVNRIENEKRFHYTVTVRGCGICKKLHISDNWVTVPKLPEGWTVTFEAKEK